MEFDLFSCTFENLNNLKFNELQKLSSRFHVTKRWAKKREIIDNILLLRDQKLEKCQQLADSEKADLIDENIEWVDGGKAFVTKGKDANQGFVSDDNDRRLTYCISTADPEITERRLTYKIEKAENLISNETDLTNFDRRLTYNADDVKYHNKDLKSIISQNYETKKDNNILQNSVVLKENTQHKSEDKRNMNNNKLNLESKTEGNINNSQAESKEYKYSTSSKIKMFTAPYKRMSTCDNIKSKMSDIKCNAEKPIENPSNTRKSICALSDNVKSGQILPEENSSESMKDNHVLKSSAIKKNISKISVKSSANCSKNIKKEILKQNITKSVLPRRKSKTEDNVLVKNLTPSRNLMFYSPKESGMKKIRGLSQPSNALDLEIACRSKIPKAKPAVSAQKPIVATKMPDFSKIHQRRFEQMDSLIDYKRKKEERVKKLFGLPQPRIPMKANKNDVTKVFQFKSSNNEKENRLNKSNSSLKKDVLKTLRGNKEKSNRKDVLSRNGSKPDIMMSLKEQNRKHLHGVRTNKRFELQMKSRKL